MARFARDLLNVPNAMSLFRLATAPAVVVLWLVLDWKVAALVVGTLGGVTDLLDGMVARRLGQVTDLGALLDQLGDLFFESSCLLIAVLIGELWPGFLFVYLFREFLVAVVRQYMAAHGAALPSIVYGKAKSNYLQWAFFVFFLGAILLEPGTVPASYAVAGVPPGRFLVWVSTVSIATGMVMSLASGWIYIRAFATFYAGRVPITPPGRPERG